jgi:hypothetical protein
MLTNVPWKETCQIYATSDGIAAYILEHCGESKAGGEEEHTCAGFGTSVAILHHTHEKIWRVPIHLAVDLLPSCSRD